MKLSLFGLAALVLLDATAAQTGDVAAGTAFFQPCAACHSTEAG
jgi:cytochrome c2